MGSGCAASILSLVLLINSYAYPHCPASPVSHVVIIRIPLTDTPFYYLTTADSHARHVHFEQAFGQYRPIRVLPVPATEFDASESHFRRTRKSGITGYLKILDAASQVEAHRFRPFVILSKGYGLAVDSGTEVSCIFYKRIHDIFCFLISLCSVSGFRLYCCTSR